MAPEVHPDFTRVRSPFEGALVRLRAVEEDDLPAINEGIWDPEVSQHLATTWPQPLAGTRRWWERGREGNDHDFVIEPHGGGVIGACSLGQIHGDTRSARLGIWIGKPNWGRGLGTDAVRVLCRFGFRELNLQRIGLGVYETNPRAIHAYRKVGFVEEGRRRRDHFIDGRYVDLILMGLLADELIEA